MFLKLLCYYFILGQNEYALISTWKTEDHQITILLVKTATPLVLLSEWFFNFYSSIPFGHISASSDQIIF
jgi:hypothetical protein